MAKSVIVLSIALATASHATSPAPKAPRPIYQGWAAMADKDIDFAIDWFKGHDILAVYPDPKAFSAVLAKARRQADGDLKQVDSFEGYRQAMKHFFSTFDDAHAYISFKLTQTRFQWPGFIAVYRGGRFVAAQSKLTSVPDGTEISSCDGASLVDWSQRIAPYEGIIPGLESTRLRAAPLIFRDAGSPFVKRPVRCVVGGKDMDLAWHGIAGSDLAQRVEHATPEPGRDVSVTPFGNDGAWVKLGNFDPLNRKESDAFEALFRQAPSLRDKAVIVFDVRGNGGGPYEWFMGVLRSLYGDAYTDYYARARMQIDPVYRLDKQEGQDPQPPETGDNAPSAPPRDTPPDDGTEDRLIAAAKARGDRFIQLPNFHRVPRPATEPANPVHARVLVLTDYGCGSACIGFVDELKRFPGVLQIGTETFVDSRTGTALATRLPSGNGTIGVPTMTRDGRERNDNEPQKPMLRFEGDIGDTAAVQAWIRDIVLAKDRH
ncbi:MAG: hypothetical protein GAK28_04230 [Luteibacter sp.]|uniref:S41 family peptidase n=1 Tax=Luteibacter sp. TaxID=1886636 RepID=UPI0013842725|nr:S41 family peptidase [Luteibacter sp.]KAF1004066.1 MAG: hypothetical protein GAK28_04230 [Luteibacter sp.]